MTAAEDKKAASVSQRIELEAPASSRCCGEGLLTDDVSESVRKKARTLSRSLKSPAPNLRSPLALGRTTVLGVVPKGRADGTGVEPATPLIA